MLSPNDDLVTALREVVRALDLLGVRYFIGGSVASSYHGAVRSTMDVDLVSEISETHVSKFLSEIGTDYYASEPAIKDAIRRRSCFNLIHLPTSFKVDVFVSRQRPFDLQAAARAKPGILGVEVYLHANIATVEDVIISKLEWYRLTDETSERQWNDVSRLMLLLNNEENSGYMRQAAEMVGVSDLLSKLIEQQSL